MSEKQTDFFENPDLEKASSSAGKEVPFFLSAENIYKKFRIGKTSIEVLKGVSLQIREGVWTALYGASGSGKTTLLDILGTISKPDSGSVTIAGVPVESLSGNDLVHFRRKNIGFIFQSYHILPELNLLENVMLPSLLEGEKSSGARARAMELLEMVGLKDRIRHRSNELSGGEQQRAAIARSLMNRPKLLLADEPTGNLDHETGTGILELFQSIRQHSGATILMVTHDQSIAGLADYTVKLSGGRLAEENIASNPL